MSKTKHTISEHFTSDPIYDNKTFICQNKNGYRFSIDALLLSWYINNRTSDKSFSHVLEIGSGHGVIPILLNRRGFSSHIECIEVQPSLFNLLERNIQTNNLSNKINAINGDFLSYSFSFEKYDIIFSNPPYFNPEKGRMNPDNEKAAARHEIFGSLDQFLKKSSKLLKHRGLFFLIFPVSRLQYALCNSFLHKLFCTELILFKENSKSLPSLFLAKFVKSNGEGTPTVSDNIIFKNNDGSYTETGKEIMYDICE